MTAATRTYRKSMTIRAMSARASQDFHEILYEHANCNSNNGPIMAE